MATQPDRNETLCAAITALHGKVSLELSRGGTKSVFFYREFLQAVSANIITEHGANNQAYLIFDNAPSHRNIEEEEALGGHLLTIDFQNTPNSSIP